MNRRRHSFLLPFLTCLLIWTSARGQEARLVSNPPLGDALPLETTSDGVRLRFPILLNAHTILEPNALLRLVYVDPNAGLHMHSGDTDKGQDHQGGFGQHHHSGKFQDTSDDDAFQGGQGGQDSADNKKALSQEAGAELWKEAELFREALNTAADIGTMVVYSVPGKQKPLSAEVDLPDGMLLADVGNQITVLALTSDSQAFQGGLQPQDEIRSLDGQPAPGSLEEFMRLYKTVTTQAQKAGQPYSFQVWRSAESKLVTIQVGAPPSLQSLF
jgi:hypothetical protein